MRSLIMVSHGTDNINGSKSIADLAKKVTESLNAAPLNNSETGAVVAYEAFIDVQQPDLPTTLKNALNATDEHATLNQSSIIVVPLLLANGYHVHYDIANAASAGGERVLVSPALGPDKRLIDVLIHRLEEVGATAQTAADDLVVLTVAGSSDDNAQTESDLVRLMLEETLSARNGFATRVELAFLSAAEPTLKKLIPRLKFQNPRKRIVIATYLLANGFFSGLTKEVGAHLVSKPLLIAGTEPPKQLVETIIDRYQTTQDGVFGQ